MQKVEVSGANGVQQRRDDTASRLIVGRDEIVQYGDSNLAAVLARQPGVSVVGSEVRLRGLGAGYTQILINGDPAPPGFSIDTLAPDTIERIEILRSAAAEYSMQAVAGSINLILRKGSSSAQREVKFGAGRGDGRWSPLASLRAADKLGNFSYGVTAVLERTAEDAEVQTRERASDSAGQTVMLRQTSVRNASSVNKASLAPRLHWDLTGSDTLTWQSLFNWYRTGFNGNARETVLLGNGTDYPVNRVTSAASIFSGRSDLAWVSSFGAQGKLTAKLGFSHDQRDTDYDFLGHAADDAPRLRRAVLSDATDDSATSSGKYLARLGAGHALSLGWDGGLLVRREARHQRDTFADGAPPYALDEDYIARVRRLALYAQDEWDLAARLQMYAGLRWEGLRTSTSGRTLAETPTRSGVWSPVMQMLWKLPEQERDQVRLALARTYKAPATRNLIPRRYTVNNGNGPNNPDFQGNPALRPELAWGLDAAWESYFGKSGVASLSAFARRISDVTVQRLFEQDGVWITTPYNQGRASVHGIEADLKFPLRSLIADAPALDLRANLARSWSRVDAVTGSDNRLASQVPATFNLGVDYHATAQWSGGASYNLQTGGLARQDRFSGSYVGVRRTLDTYALWQQQGGFRLRLSLLNLLHQQRLQGQWYQDGQGASDSMTSTASGAVLRLLIERSL
ncbi:TonB-dependent receptor plug domain-containing protein [Janthinobacterium aquaticum]|nr:TonB-dependent receptor plug domain-containing protein [Janthinobacterium sp. FT58W]